MFVRLSFILLWLLAHQATAQVGISAGPNINWARAPTLQGTVQPSVGFQGSWRYVILDTAHRLSPTIGGTISRQGYRQSLVGQTHQLNFFYITAHLGLGYRAHPFISVYTAIELSRLVAARYLLVGTNGSIGVINTYRSFRPAARLEVVLWKHRWVSPYISIAHDLRPALRYPRIDATGNFDGILTDLWHRTLSVGIQVNL